MNAMDWREIDGWLSEQEGAELQRLAAGRIVLEIGSFRGRSTVCLAQVATQVVAVDPHTALTFGGKWRGQDSLATCRANLAAAGVADRVIVVPAAIEIVAPRLRPQYGLVFIDGDHSEEACFRDLEIAAQLILSPAAIAVHDYGAAERHLAGVRLAVDRWRGGRAMRRVKSLAIFEVCE